MSTTILWFTINFQKKHVAFRAIYPFLQLLDDMDVDGVLWCYDLWWWWPYSISNYSQISHTSSTVFFKKKRGEAYLPVGLRKQDSERVMVSIQRRDKGNGRT